VTTYNNPRLITPPREEEEIFPYRRAWRSVFIESSLLIVLMLLIFVAFNFLGISLSGATLRFVNILLALMPTIFWLIFSRIPENSVVEPRRRLLTVFTVTALVANAIGLPMLKTVFEPDAWLPLQSPVFRILGYMATVGILQEFLKYLVIRYIVWPSYYRVRLDSVAYGAATAVAYALVVSLDYVLSNPLAAPDVVMLRVFATLAVHMLGSIIVGFGLSETLFSHALAFFLPMMILLSALVSGLAVAMRASFMNAALSITTSSQREIFGLGFSLVIYLAGMAVFFFLFNITERREQDKIIGQER
jgi:hypothetical protein